VKVMVTGGGGFIGSHVMEKLTEYGIESVSFDLHGDGPAGAPWRRLDVRSYAQVYSMLAGCTHVIHLAGVLGTAELFPRAHDAVDANVHGTLNVLQACEYRGAAFVGITMPDVWDNVYQATKLCAKRLASAWHRHKGVPVSHVRAYNAFGVGQKVHGVQKIIPTFADRAWKGEPLPVWGDGTQQVDLVWAGDLAEMLIRACEFGDDQVFDGGTATGLSVNEVASYVIARAGNRSQISYLPMRAGEHPAKVVAEGEGWDLLGYTSQGVRWDMLDRTVDSYRR
jgi:UDP-glucose 4-epimerase